jgi:hypothetical protein
MRGATFVVALAIFGVARTAAADDPDHAQLLVWPRLAEVGGTLGATVNGGTATVRTSAGFQGYGRVDLARIDRPSIGADVGRIELGGTVLDGARFGARFLSVDRFVFGTGSKLGEQGQRVATICVWLASQTPCTGGYVGFGAELLDVQYGFASGRGAMRIVEGTFVWSPLPSFDDRDNVLRVLPLRVGAELDYVWGVPSGDTFVGRLVVGSDLSARFADRHGEVALSARWRPSFTGFVTDWGVEAKAYLGYVGSYTAFQQQGAPWRIGVELGFAHWEDPSHALGLAWGDAAGESFFARLVVSGAIWSLH